MNIYEYISQAVTALNSPASVQMHHKGRKGVKTQENSGITIVINPIFRGKTNFAKNLNAIDVPTYEIDFLNLDEWDNFDYKNDADKGTFQIIEEMKQLAASVFKKIESSNNLPLIGGFKWSYVSLVRVNANTESGIRVTIEFPDFQNLICNYGD